MDSSLAPVLSLRPEVWLAEFEFTRRTGEVPVPLSLSARELRSRRLVRLSGPTLRRGLPFSDDALLLAYDGPATVGCLLSLGAAPPEHILDLHAEFRRLTSGMLQPGDSGLKEALAHFGLQGEGLDGLEKLMGALGSDLDLPRALLRGRYSVAVARMEAVGVPIDVPLLLRLRDGWERLRHALVARLDAPYGVYRHGKFNPVLWRRWKNKNRVRWPEDERGYLKLDLKTFREVAKTYPSVRQMAELRATLSHRAPLELAVGPDGRNRTPLRPFSSKTGRNQPSTSRFVFGPATWVRGFIKPAEGMALAYIDYEQQEFGIAAALSGDRAMSEAYSSGDPYLRFALQARAVPAGATKESHRELREQFKTCALGVQYGMSPFSLAGRLGGSLRQGRNS